MQGIRFGLKDPEPAKAQALRAAVVMGRAHCEAMASGAGLRPGSVQTISEAGSVRVQTVLLDSRAVAGAANAVTTPIESGLVTVHASVTVQMELLP